MSDSDDFGAFLAGFFVGALAGAAAALLMAPQSGEETRMLIRDKSIELKDKATVTVDEARVKADAIMADARTKAEATLADARVKADELTAQAKVRAEEITKKSQAVLDEQKARIEKAVEPLRKKKDSTDAAPAEDAV